MSVTECEQLRVTIEQMKEDRILNDVVHVQFIKSFEELHAKLEEKTKECEALNEKNAKLVKDLRIQAAVDDCNASLSRELAKKTKECQVLNEQKTKLVEDLRIKIGVDASNASLVLKLSKKLAVIPKGEAVSSPDLQKKIDELTVKYEDAMKRLGEK
ncbi:hypothetical protein GIB67_004012 [Kingdonia uniflora]|uniref:Uncharacterized protein n=1 Tax=Kingdonia uniflora TaxID=39325 RepID=A0A7J7NRE3_9MAGN|nr:hypothetical protein GIB67_004012 [Kingdonia uniflora]